MLLKLFIIFLVSWVADSEQWKHSRTFDDGKYQVHWTVKDDIILFQTEVQCRGYVGFGLSTNGGMAGSDIVIGWINDGFVYFHDRHGTGNVMPVLDEQQDWHLVTATENDTHNVFKFYRKLQTCDEENDLEIDEGTLKLIYSYSDEDPKDVNQISYHFSNRGFTSVKLLRIRTPKRIATEGMPYWDVRTQYHLTPDVKSMYWCRMVKSPKIGKKHHVLKLHNVLAPGNEKNVHHMLMHRCNNENNEELLESYMNVTFPCHDVRHGKVMTACDDLTLSYSMGSEDLEFPENAGFPFKSEDYYIIEVHYDNSGGFDKMDNSGFRIFYTPELKQYDIGFLPTGALPRPRLVIPPRVENYTVSGHVNFSQFDSKFPKDGIHIISMMLHAHTKGKHIIARHFRQGVELKPILEDKYYDYAYQNYDVLSEEVHVLPDDHMTVECVFNTMDRNKTTFGGPSASDEMCEANFYYYPAFETRYCLSTVSKEIYMMLPGIDEKSEEPVVKQLENLDWGKVDIPEFENMNRFLPQISCVAFDKDPNPDNTWVTYPKNFTPFVKPDKCKKDSTKFKNLPLLMSNNNSFRTKGEFAFVLLLSILIKFVME